jgi:hypothetical protein
MKHRQQLQQSNPPVNVPGIAPAPLGGPRPPPTPTFQGGTPSNQHPHPVPAQQPPALASIPQSAGFPVVQGHQGQTLGGPALATGGHGPLGAIAGNNAQHVQQMILQQLNIIKNSVAKGIYGLPAVTAERLLI